MLPGLAICQPATVWEYGAATGWFTFALLQRLGLGKVAAIDGLDAHSRCTGLYGKLRELSNGKDTQTGHWEMMGVVSSKTFPTYPEGFPPEVITEFVEKTGCKKILCNKPASGTTVLEELGEEHASTGHPIVYTSGDSVFQIATNIDVIPLQTLYRWCEIARTFCKDRIVWVELSRARFRAPKVTTNG